MPEFEKKQCKLLYKNNQNKGIQHFNTQIFSGLKLALFSKSLKIS